MWDVVTIGETMLRLTPPGLKRLEQTDSLAIEIGGSESNTAAGLARLGVRTLWISRLTHNPLGEKIARTIASHGVDTSRVSWTDEDRIGTYYYEEGSAPRSSFVIYDRKQSAASKITPADLPQDLFAPGNARMLHFCGITPALSASALETSVVAAEAAKKNGWLFSFDTNYRAKLWTPESASDAYERFFALADIVFAPTHDLARVFQRSSAEPQQLISFLRKKMPKATLVVTAGKDGAYASANGDLVFHTPIFPSSGIGRLGGGDSFSAGFLASFLDDETDLARALRWGAAAAALKYSTHGDLPCFTREEVLALASNSGAEDIVQR